MEAKRKRGRCIRTQQDRWTCEDEAIRASYSVWTEGQFNNAGEFDRFTVRLKDRRMYVGKRREPAREIFGELIE